MEPKILVMDIETSPILGYVWDLFDQNVAINQIHTDWCILSWSAKWYGDPASKIMYKDNRKKRNYLDDKQLVKSMWKLLDEADIIITQNGKSFDEKKLNARFAIHGLPPPSSFRHIDTCLIARKKFKFTSNKLEYLAKKLNKKYNKFAHKKYPGFELWRECMKGNIDAWNHMEKYNKQDVLALEELYTRLIPWDSSINFSIYSGGEHHVCSCGSRKFNKRGFFFTNTGKYQRYKCKKCGRETRDRKKVTK